MGKKEMVTVKTWEDFRETGLLLIINQVLHIFGWAIVLEVTEANEVVECYPARGRFRGFDNKSTEKAYIKISQYMNDNVDKLLEEATNG